ncbi:MAG: glutathione synthase [Ferrovum sp.]|jgi:glutathione synthase|nr:glutathione synthase [Ferrovum sp.]
MDLAFLIDPLDQLKPDKDSTLEIMRAANQRGHRLFAIEPTGLQLDQGWVQGWTLPLDYTTSPGILIPQRSAASFRKLCDFSAVLMRKDPPVDSEYLFATHLLDLAEGQGARVFNRPQALRDYNEKLATALFPHLCPPTLVARTQDAFRIFLKRHQDIILKPLDGMGGREIFRVKAQDPNVAVILETLTRNETRTIMAQQYLPAIQEGDKRVLMVQGEPLPYCLARLPAQGETRGNLAAGGRGIAQPLDPSDQRLAEEVGPFLRKAGVLLAGLDIIGTHLTEINLTSPTCFREIRDQTGFDGAMQVIEALERACRQI